MKGSKKLHIFLDINGVLNNRSSVLEGIFFLPEKIKLVNILLYEYNPTLVISSDWKHVYSIENIKFALDMAGLMQLIDFTHTNNVNFIGGKENEIMNYIKEYKLEKNQFVIFDDDDFSDKFITDHHIKVDPNVGLTYDNIFQAKTLFNLQPN